MCSVMSGVSTASGDLTSGVWNQLEALLITCLTIGADCGLGARVWLLTGTLNWAHSHGLAASQP